MAACTALQTSERLLLNEHDMYCTEVRYGRTLNMVGDSR